MEQSNSNNDKRPIKENELLEFIYNVPHYFKKSSLIIIGILCLFLGLFFNFSLEEKLIILLGNTLQTLGPCSLNYKEIRTSLFLPKFIIENPSIPGPCLGTESNLTFKSFEFGPRGISLFPFGPKFVFEAELPENNIVVAIGLGLFTQVLNFNDTEINLAPFLKSLNQNALIQGKLDIDSVIKIKSRQLSEGSFLIKTSNLSLPPQNIFELDIPQLKIGKSTLKATLNENKDFVIDSFVIGDEQSPIRAIIKGSVKLNTRDLKSSRLDLKAEASFSEDLMNKFKIIAIMLSNYPKSNGMYQIKIGGTLGQPLPAPL